jgi:hypothetical protein
MKFSLVYKDCVFRFSKIPKPDVTHLALSCEECKLQVVPAFAVPVSAVFKVM